MTFCPHLHSDIEGPVSGEQAGTSEAAVAEAGQEESGAADPRDAIIAALRERVVALGKVDRRWFRNFMSCRRIGSRWRGVTLMPDPFRPPLPSLSAENELGASHVREANLRLGFLELKDAFDELRSEVNASS